MTTITSLQRTTAGRLYFNHFTATDDTTKSNQDAYGVWSLDTGNSILKLTCSAGSYLHTYTAYYNSGVVDAVCLAKFKSVTVLQNVAAAVRLSNYLNFFTSTEHSSGNHRIYECLAGSYTSLATTAHAAVADRWYWSRMKAVGSALSATLYDAVVGTTTRTATDSDLSTPIGQGVTVYVEDQSMVVQFDFIHIYRSETITVNGLLDGQKFLIYDGGVLMVTSVASSGGVCTADTSTVQLGLITDNWDRIDITDTDGVTVIYSDTTSWADIIGGDIYQTQVTQTPLKNPPYALPPVVDQSRLYAYTKRRAYTNMVFAEISPPSAGKLGVFRLQIPDPGRDEEVNFGPNEMIWIGGKLGIKHDRLLRGFVDRTTPVQLHGGHWGLEIAGRSWGAYAEVRHASSTTPYTNKEISEIVKLLASEVPELTFGNYIYSTGVTLSSWTIIRGRSIWNALLELAALASNPTVTWGVWECGGEHQGEYGKPNIHFGPIRTEVGLVPLTELNSFRITSPKDARQIVTRTVVAYWTGAAVAYLTTNAVGPGSDRRYSLNLDGVTNYVTVADADSLDFGV